MPTHTLRILSTLLLTQVFSSALAAGMPALPIAAADPQAQVGTSSPSPASLPTMSEAVQPSQRSPGAPKYEDICFSPRSLSWSPRNQNVVDVAKIFHATRLEWVYADEGDVADLQKLSSLGITLGLSVGPHDTPEKKKGPIGFKAKPEYYTEGRALDIDGNQVEHGLGSLHDPAYDEVEKRYFRLFGQLGAKRIHKDDADWKYRDWDFNPHALTQFNAYLAANVPPETRETLGIGDPATFDLKTYVQKYTKENPIPPEFKKLWEDFRLETLRNRYKKQRQWAEEFMGPGIEFTANHGSFIQSTPTTDWSDWPISELQPSGTYFGIGNPWSLYAKVQKFRAMGKALVVTLGSSDTLENKTMIALTYAMGSHMLCPYAVYLKNNLPRYYPDPALYSDIYDFVNRWGKTYFAGYEEAFVVGNGITHPLAAQGQAPLQIKDPADSVYAFVRAKPGKPNDPVVIHLVNWNKDARANVGVTLDPERFFPARGLKLSLLRPDQEPEILSDGWQAQVEVPAPDPWSILIAEPATSKGPQVWAAEVETEDFGFFDKRTAVLHSRTPGAEIHYTTDGTEPTQKSPRYEKPIEMTKTTTLRTQVFQGAQASKLSSFVFPDLWNFFKGSKPSAQASPLSAFQFTKLASNSLNPAPAVTPGLECELREGIKLSYDNHATWEQGTYEFKKATTSISEQIALPPGGPKSFFALNFTGFLDVPADGLYTFFVQADEECRVFIDDKLVVNQSGRISPPDIGMREMQGRCLLSQGLHKLRVEFIQVADNCALEVKWQGPGFAKQPIPAENLKH